MLGEPARNFTHRLRDGGAIVATLAESVVGQRFTVCEILGNGGYATGETFVNGPLGGT